MPLRLAEYQRASASAGAMAGELWIAAAMRQSNAEIKTIAARPTRQRADRRAARSQPLAKVASAAITCGTSCVRCVVKWEWDWNEAGGGHASARFDDVLESCELADLVVHRLLHHGRH